MSRTFKHMTYEQRCLLKDMYGKYSIQQIADTLGFHHSTIRRELDKGSINGIYYPDIAEAEKQANLAAKGPDAILSTNPQLAQTIADYILKEHYSPKKIASILKSQPNTYPNCTITHTTIYSAIDNGLIPGVTRESLHSETTQVYNNGCITLAKWIREELDIKDGDSLRFEITEDGKIIFFKIEDSN